MYQKCPICKGVGSVPKGFYDGHVHPWVNGAPEREVCRACNGKGILYCPDPTPIYPEPPYHPPYWPQRWPTYRGNRWTTSNAQWDVPFGLMVF